MVRKALMVMLAFVMVVGTLVTSFPMGIAYAENYIDFDNQQLNNSTLTNPYEHNSSKVDMDATLNNVDGASINYTVEQIVDANVNPPRVDQSTSSTRAGILVNGSKMTIVGLRLFAGLNRITFTGNSGGATITQTIYVSYIDAPTLSNLTIFGGTSGKELRIRDKSDTIVTPDYVSHIARGTIFIKGTAPNVNQVTVNVIDVTTGNRSGITVSVSSTDSSFITSGLNLVQGKNRLQFILQNDDQYSETYRDLVYYNGDITFYNEELTLMYDNNGDGVIDNNTVDPGETKSQSMRNYSPFNVFKGPIGMATVDNRDKVKLQGRVIVPNNYSADQVPLRVNAIYMKAKDFVASGTITNDVDEKEQIVIEFNKAVDNNGSNYTAEDINKMMRFYYVKNENPGSVTGKVIEIPALDTKDPSNSNQSYGEWDATSKVFTITLGSADVQKFRSAWSNTSLTPSSTTVNKPFVLFKQNLAAQDGSPGIGAALTLDENPTGYDELVIRSDESPLARGDVLLVGSGIDASSFDAVTNANSNKRWALYGEATILNPSMKREQIHVVGMPDTTVAENARIVDAKLWANETATGVLDAAGVPTSQVEISVAPTSINADNSYTVVMRRQDGTPIASTLGLAAGDLVKFGSTYAIIAQTPSPTGSSLKVYAPLGTTFTLGDDLFKISYTPKAGAESLGDDTGRTIGVQKINSTFNGTVTQANARLSLNVGSEGNVVRFNADTISSGHLLEIGGEYVISGLPYASADGVTNSQLGDSTTNTSVSMLPVIGLSGKVLSNDTVVKKLAIAAPDHFIYTPAAVPVVVDTDQRVGMDGKIRLKIESANFTSTNKVKRNELIQISDGASTFYAIATEEVTTTTSMVNLIAPPNALIKDGMTVRKLLAASTFSPIVNSGGKPVTVKGQLGLGAPGSLSTPTGNVSFMPGNLGYFVAGSFDSTQPSIIKSTIVANSLGTYKVDEEETVEVYFQDPKGDLRRSPSSVTSNIVVEGKYGSTSANGYRATLSQLGLQTSLSWPGNPGNNPMMKVRIETKGDPFFEDYGYISLNGLYPMTTSGATMPVNNLPVTGALGGTDTRYAMVLVGNTFDGDSRSPKPDVNNLIGSVLDANFEAIDDNGVVPNYEAKLLFRDATTRNVLVTLDHVKLRVIKGESYKESEPYYVFQFESYNPDTVTPGGFLPSIARDFNTKYLVEVSAINTTLSPADYQGTQEGELSYSLELPNRPSLFDINFLAKPQVGSTITQADLLNMGASSSSSKFSKLTDNTTIYNTPFAIEYQVIDPSKDDLNSGQGDLYTDVSKNQGATPTPLATDPPNNFDIQITSTSPSGETVDLTSYNSSSPSSSNVIKYLQSYATGSAHGDAKAAYDVYNSSKDVTGDNRKDDVKRIVLMLKELPFSGTQTLKFTFTYKNGSTTGSYTIERTINYVSGAYVNFDTMYDGQVINRDTTEAKTVLINDIVVRALGKLRGDLRNVDLKDPAVFTMGDVNQKLYLYVNNFEVALQQESVTKPNRFIVDESKTSFETIYDQLKAGENKIVFLYKSNGPNSQDKDIYKKELVIRISSTNIPELPAKDKDIYPYPVEFNLPKKDAKRFPGADGIYSTEEKKLNVYGSFDFLDLGTNRSVIESKLSTLLSGTTPLASNYILEIKRNDGLVWTWDLTKRFADDAGNTYNSGSNITPSGLAVKYVRSTQNFEFVISNQEMPKDGTELVYSIRVYNAGFSGPYAAKNLEISSKVMPYTILRPTKQELAGSINRNYLEVVIEAKGADSVLVDKVQAKQIDFDEDNDGDKEYKDVFKAVIMNLKPNKKNTIKFTITKGTEKTTGQFDIMYAQDNIPGAQWMEPMKASHSVFSGAVQVTFPKDTYLRRMDPKSPNKYKTQVYADHSLLFGIANPDDGVVDRYDYQKVPSSFRTDVSLGKQLLQASFDRQHFILISPMYWVDGGLADDDDTENYDDVKEGFLPHQLPSSDLPNFNKRQDDLMVVPTQRGKIKLNYDKSVVADASMWITVFRFDPDEKTWTNVGGVVDPQKRQVTANFDRFGYYMVAKMSNSFNDISQHSYARNHTEAIYVKGILKPKRDNEFGVDSNITRGEFAAMIVRALQVPLNFDPDHLNFDDVPLAYTADSLYDYRYIETAANMGILRGTTPRVFEPDKPITREDASVILSRALQFKQDTDPAKVTKDLQKLFKDYNLISSYSRAAVLAIAKKKYVNGSPIDEKDPKKGYIFEPSAYLLRGDASIIMANIMKDLKTLPAIQAVR
ncbi:S-layer homology domain-containing protein [Brevibacillus sp. SYSU BS000544]|uniref:S-layer homology domain-containing protein n=1 Tax=Brevibacillus sp. SYSU BS000544 TaxID=3416443 RepID=UPI003CE51890